MGVSFGKKGQKPKPKAQDKQAAKTGADAVMAALQKDHGEGFASYGGHITEAERIPLGVFPFDLATGGGVPRGRVTSLNGPEGGAKSLHGYKFLVAVQQRLKMKAVLVDIEHVADKKWLARAGLNVENLIVVKPDNGEQAVDAIEAFMYAYDVGGILIDSIAALQPNNMIESEAGKASVGGNANLVTKLSNKITAAFSREAKKDHHPAVVAINQIRHKVGYVLGNPETNPGGFAFGHATSLRVRFYSKNIIIKEVNPQLSTYKHVTGVIQKWRVPIVGQTFEYDMAVIEHTKCYDDELDIPMSVGDVDAAKTVMAYIQSLGLMEKGKKGYTVLGQSFKTQNAIEIMYRGDDDFREAVNQKIWALAKQEYGQNLNSGDEEAQVDTEIQAAMEHSS